MYYNIILARTYERKSAENSKTTIKEQNEI